MSIAKLFESAKDIKIYQKLLQILGEYSDAFPATGVDGMFEQALDNKTKILPSDKQALEILHYLLFCAKTPAAVVQKLLNTRFVDLPAELRPAYKDGQKKQIAFWGRADKIYDKVISMIDFADEGKVQGFVNEKGEKVKVEMPEKAE